MIHIEVVAFGAPPCQGSIAPVSQDEGRRSLPIVGSTPKQRWRCLGCGKEWDHEPTPLVAL